MVQVMAKSLDCDHFDHVYGEHELQGPVPGGLGGQVHDVSREEVIHTVSSLGNLEMVQSTNSCLSYCVVLICFIINVECCNKV